MADNVTRDLARMIYNSALSESKTRNISFSDAIVEIKSRLEETKRIRNQLKEAQEAYERLYKDLDSYMQENSRRKYFNSNTIFSQIQSIMNSQFDLNEEGYSTTKTITRDLFKFKSGSFYAASQVEITKKANELAKAYDKLYNATLAGMNILRINGESIRGDKALYHLGINGQLDSKTGKQYSLRELLISGETWEKMEHQRGIFEIAYNPLDKENPGLNLRVNRAGQKAIQNQIFKATGKTIDLSENSKELSKIFAQNRIINAGRGAGGENVTRQQVWELLMQSNIPTMSSIQKFPNDPSKWSYIENADKFELLNSGQFDKAKDLNEIKNIINNQYVNQGIVHDSSFGQARGDTMIQMQSQMGLQSFASQEKYSGKGGGFNIINLQSLIMGLTFYTDNKFLEQIDERKWDELSPQEQEQFIENTLGDFSDEGQEDGGLEGYAYSMTSETLEEGGLELI